MSRPGPIRSDPSCCIGNDEVVKTCPSAQRTTVRSIDDIKSLPQPALDETATLGDERDAAPRGTPVTEATPSTPPARTRIHTPERHVGPAAETPGACDGVQCGTMHRR